MNRFRCLLALLTCLVLAAFAQAQDNPAQGTTHVTLGRSIVPLYGPWKFTVGDSPVDPATHAPLWGPAGLRRFPLGDGRPDAERGSRSPGRLFRLRDRLDIARASRLFRLRLVPHPGPGNCSARRKIGPGRSLGCRRCLSTLQRRSPGWQLRWFHWKPTQHLLYPAHDVQSAARGRFAGPRPGFSLLDGPQYARDPGRRWRHAYGAVAGRCRRGFVRIPASLAGAAPRASRGVLEGLLFCYWQGSPSA